MLLGLHTYSFHLHGMGQNWGGHQLAWERVWDIFGLMDEAKKLGLEGLHLTAVDLGATDDCHLVMCGGRQRSGGFTWSTTFHWMPPATTRA